MTQTFPSNGSPASPSRFFQDRTPIRSNLLGPAGLRELARNIAAASSSVCFKGGRKLLEVAAADARSLESTRRRLAIEASRAGRLTGPAEWLYDNFHIIDEASREIETDLPPGYYVRLPQLSDGWLKGIPRVYWLACELLAHVDSALDEATLFDFVREFQRVTPLTIGELWAVPIMLRLVLLQNLARLGESVHADYVDVPNHPTPSNDSTLANQISIGNAVTSLRLMSSIDWPVFYERSSLVHAQLGKDPAEAYSLQDFATRDRYRQAVEMLARYSSLDELAVCERLLGKASSHTAEQASQPWDRPAASHVGYYLIGPGRRGFEKELGYRPDWRSALVDFVRRHSRICYFASLTGVALLLTTVTVLCFPGRFAWLIALAVLPIAIELAINLVNNIVTRLIPPQTLPKLDFSKGIPDECSTFVVIPTLLTSRENNANLVSRLEIHALSNPDPNLYFALLTDWTDSATETTPRDEESIKATLAGIRELNQRYATSEKPRFFLLHRKRLWNPLQNRWMGWERKRGKLSEFNRLLLGDRNTTHSFCSCELSQLPKVRFVITLDSDTQLPRETAQRLVGTLAHPLCRPRFDPELRRVTEGYSILQPRVSVAMLAARKSRFARLLAGSAGIDPYTTATSDVYQDLFGLGTFTGKGIYDLRGFEDATGSTFPNNHILSHDLIEGNYARCGLVSDIEFVDDLPTRYNAFAKREHRWVRGDWQLLPWLGPSAPVPPSSGETLSTISGRERDWQSNPLPLVERWKVFDNLRRSLIPPSLLLLLLLGWTILPGPAWFWTLFSLLVPMLPVVFGIPGFFAATTRPAFWLSSANDAVRGILATLGQSLMQISFLPHQAWMMVDAILRTLFRLFWSGRNLLEWETAAATERRLGNSLHDFIRFMIVGPIVALAAFVAVSFLRPTALFVAAPVLLLWFLSPLLAWWVSLPSEEKIEPLTETETREARRIARKTWAFFETFVTPDDHMLPPDNFQEHPLGVLARRTSPTNIGLSLLANLAAHDFGYIGVRRLLERTSQTIATLEKLERHHGHFLNWYRTDTLTPLEPKYISTVDSGNLLACLITLRQGLLEKSNASLASLSWRHGLSDTLRLAQESIHPAHFVGKVPDSVSGPLKAIERVIAEPSASWIDELVSAASDIDLDALAELDEVERWVGALVTQVRELRDEAALNARTVRDVPEFDMTIRRLQEIVQRLEKEMDFRVLYNDSRHLFSIGFNLSTGRYDTSHYDLMASEACLTSFLTVARGEAHRRHWFQIGRPITSAGQSIALVSWGGTMFEYLLPRIFFRPIADTLLEETRGNIVRTQISYGKTRGVPWGISESGYNLSDSEGNYQYMSFGVPGLGLKRGLDRDLVVSPYSTLLAVMVRPHESIANFEAIRKAGGEGPFGFYEAIDFTPGRLKEGQRAAVIQSYMAHHQGMGFLALANCLLGEPFPARFHADPVVRSAELLLQEKIPWSAPIQDVTDEASFTEGPQTQPDPTVVRQVSLQPSRQAKVHAYAHGRSRLLVTHLGDQELTLGKGDLSSEASQQVKISGPVIYISDFRERTVWSVGHHPAQRQADDYFARFAIDKAVLNRRDGAIETSCEAVISRESAGIVQRVSVTNHDSQAHDLELTAFLEILSASLPTNSKRECIRVDSGIAVANGEAGWVVLAAADESNRPIAVRVLVNREAFLSRGGLARPDALSGDSSFPSVSPAECDGSLALNVKLTVPAGQSKSLCFLCGIADDQQAAQNLADLWQHPNSSTRSFELAWADALSELSELEMTAAQAHAFQRLIPALQNGQPKEPDRQWLNSLGLSGARPVVVIEIDENSDPVFSGKLLAGQKYLERRGLPFDIVAFSTNPAEGKTLAARSHQSATKESGTFLVLPANHPDRNTIARIAAFSIGPSVKSVEELARLIDPT